MSTRRNLVARATALAAAGMLLLVSGHRAGAAVTAETLEAFARHPAGTLDGFGNGPAIQGSAIRQVFDADAGSTLTFRFNFLTDEPEPASPLDAINHFAFVSIVDSGGAVILAETLADAIGSTGLALTPSSTGFARETGFAGFDYAFGAAGTFTLAIGVVSVTDAMFNTGLLIDALALGGGTIVNGGFESGDFSGFGAIGTARVVTSAFGSGPPEGQFQASLATVPEPGAAALLGLGLAGGLAWRRRARPAS